MHATSMRARNLQRRLTAVPGSPAKSMTAPGVPEEGHLRVCCDAQTAHLGTRSAWRPSLAGCGTRSGLRSVCVAGWLRSRATVPPALQHLAVLRVRMLDRTCPCVVCERVLAEDDLRVDRGEYTYGLAVLKFTASHLCGRQVHRGWGVGSGSDGANVSCQGGASWGPAALQTANK